MTNPFAVPSKGGGSSNRLSSPSGGSNPFAGGTPSSRQPEQKKKTNRGFLGTLAHIPVSVGHDIASLASVPVGLYETAAALGQAQRGRPEKAIALGKGTAAATKEELQHPLRHPLYTALDVLTLASLGAGGAVRAGLLSGERAALETRSVRAFKQAGEGPVDVRLSSTKPLVRGRQRAFKAAQRRLSEVAIDRNLPIIGDIVASGYNFPLVGEGATYARRVRVSATRKGLQELPVYERYHRLRDKLSLEEKQALAIIPRDVHPADIAEALKDTENAAVAANPKVAELVLNPTPRLARAEQAQRQLATEGERMFQELGFLGQESIKGRPGFTIEPRKATPTKTVEERAIESVVGRKVRAPDRDNLGTVKEYDPVRDIATVRFVNRAEGAMADIEFPLADLRSAKKRRHIVGAKPITVPPVLPRAERYRATISEQLGREAQSLHGQPYYLPDLTTPPKRTSPLAGTGGGVGLVKTPGTARLNEQVNATLGRIDFTNDLLGPEFIRRVHARVHNAVYNALRDSSLRLTADELSAITDSRGRLPKGWEYLRAPVVGKTTGAVRAQRISPSRLEPGETAMTPKALRDLIPDPADMSKSKLTDHLGTTIREKAFHDGQFYYVAPSKTIKSAAGQFAQSSPAVRMFIEKPLTVWRALVLGLRPGFLVNNVVGNNLLYAVATMGTGGLRAYLHALQESGVGKPVLRRLIGQDYVPRGISTQLMEEFFPEQIHGTFGRTQAPTEGTVRGKAARIGHKAGAGIIPLTSSVAETLPRRALVENMIRRSPEFKKVYKAVPREARDFNQIARKVLTDRGEEYQRLISEQVNNALGDYVSLGAAERNVVRNIVPFYAWYKAIATIAFHMAADTPGRALILSRLGEIGQEDTARTFGKLPAWLQGIIPIGERQGDVQTILSTGGLNPYATLPQVGSGFTEDIQGLGLAPYISVPAYVLAHSYGQPTSLRDILAQSAYSFGRNLPPSRVIAPLPPSKLYPQRSRKSELLSFLGVPLKDLNVPEANRRAER